MELRKTLLLSLDDLAAVREFIERSVSRLRLDRDPRRHGVSNLKDPLPMPPTRRAPCTSM